MSIAPPPPATAVQPSFADIGTPLRDVTFVVVDLETTGSRADDAGITEIGAVKVRGGEVLGEFQSLVNPGRPVPAFVARLTGITTAMVSTAPGVELVLPGFLEFARGTVLVAHNAPFDIGFLRAACAGLDYAWPGFDVVDTLPLARRTVPRDEAPNHTSWPRWPGSSARRPRPTTEPSPMPVPPSTCCTPCSSASPRSA